MERTVASLAGMQSTRFVSLRFIVSKALGLNRMAPLYMSYEKEEGSTEGLAKIVGEMTEYLGEVATIQKGMSGNGMTPFIVYVAWFEEA